MLRSGIIGTGNCGNQVAAKACHQLNIDGIALNTSDQDLEKVKGVDNLTTFSLGDKKGAGQSRADAKAALKGEVQRVLEDKEFKSFISSQEIIYIVSSTGGGTGSGISPLLSHLIRQMTDVPVILVGVLPTLDEDRGVQINTLNYLKELYSVLQEPTYMLYDNNRLVNKGSVNMMTEINASIVRDICILSGFHNISTEFASIDDRDMKRLVSPPGMITLGSVLDINEKDLDTNSIEELMVQDLKTNTHCELDYDGVVANTGIITKLSPRINANFNMNIPEIHGFIGQPSITGFKHIAINSDSSFPNDVFFIASGLSPVNDRIRKINERVAEIDASRKDSAGAVALENSVLDNGMTADRKVTGTPDIASSFEMFGA